MEQDPTTLQGITLVVETRKGLLSGFEEIGHRPTVQLFGERFLLSDESTFLQVIVGLFLILEFANVLALYFTPGSDKFNAVGVFGGWKDSMDDPDLHAFVSYLVFWVAGTKLIFLGLWMVILLTAGPTTQLLASVIMVPAIATFYWRLFPIVRTLDRKGKVLPTGYSRTLGWMIAAFILAFVIAIVVAL